MAKIFTFSNKLYLQVSKEVLWEFISNSDNLLKITPPEMKLKVLNQGHSGFLVEGMETEYTVSPLFGISMYWKSKIVKLHTGEYFEDMQLKGPYKYWVHKHTIATDENGTYMLDEISYAVPGFIFENIINNIIVKPKLHAMFAYRNKIITDVFANK